MDKPNTRNNKKPRKRKFRVNWKAVILAIACLIVFVAIVVGAVFLIKKMISVNEISGLKFSSTTTSTTLTWKRTQKDAFYQIQKKGESGAYEDIATVTSEKDTTYTDENIPSGTFIEYKVIACRNIVGKTKKSNGKKISGYTLPVAPSDCVAFTQSKNSLTVCFTDSQEITSYEIKYSEDENFTKYETLKIPFEDVTLNQEDKTLNYLINDLTENKTYYFQIRCFINKKIYSEWSDVFSGNVIRAIDMAGIDPNKPMVAITYDDGPGPGGHTERIIEAFKQVGGHATFFQLGNRAESYPSLMQLMVENGHEIGCHTYDHKHSGDEVTSDDIVHANDVIEASCGVRPTLFRSPGGSTTDLMRSVCLSEGIPIIQWNVDTKDWKTKDAASVCEEIKNTIADGNIILMHNIYESTATATEQILPWLVEQGYQLVTVSQLIQAKTGNPPTAGIQYYTATNTK